MSARRWRSLQGPAPVGNWLHQFPISTRKPFSIIHREVGEAVFAIHFLKHVNLFTAKHAVAIAVVLLDWFRLRKASSRSLIEELAELLDKVGLRQRLSEGEGKSRQLRN